MALDARETADDCVLVEVVLLPKRLEAPRKLVIPPAPDADPPVPVPVAPAPDEADVEPPVELEEDADEDPAEDDPPPPSRPPPPPPLSRPPPPPPLLTMVTDMPPPPRPPPLATTTVMPAPPREPRSCGAVNEANLSAVVEPVRRRVFCSPPVATTVVRTAATPPGPPDLAAGENCRQANQPPAAAIATKTRSRPAWERGRR